MTIIPGTAAQLVSLNIGGQVFRTTLATLQVGLHALWAGQLVPAARPRPAYVPTGRVLFLPRTPILLMPIQFQGGSSMLSKMFSGDMEPGLRDEQGRIYLHRQVGLAGRHAAAAPLPVALRRGGGETARAPLPRPPAPTPSNLPCAARLEDSM